MAYRRSTIPKIQPLADALGKSVDERFEDLLHAYAKDCLKGFREAIRQQQFTSFVEVPLSPSYAHFKEAVGLDERTMIATGTYVRNLRVWRGVNAEKGIEFHVGFREGAMAVDRDGEETDFPLWKLALVQEFGSLNGNVPPRPHWMPYFRRLRRAMPQVAKSMIDTIMEDVRRSAP